ncbi:CopG family ribbon-helix-helix protein [Piscinibacterium candidicorallinum]|uniref:CopG family ribbon-helix-helix protein n=1 Tax=Piscinibacterium candidicorallinum TaxID=1793872 RepID=A0ABV7H8W6_9BURK
MPTTSLKIDDELKQRIAAVAQAKDTNAHAWMVDTLKRAIEQAEQEVEFLEIAEKRWAKFKRDGKSVSQADMEAYLDALVTGKPARKPEATAWSK